MDILSDCDPDRAISPGPGPLWSLEDPSQIMINREEIALLPPMNSFPLFSEVQDSNAFVPSICKGLFDFVVDAL